MFTTDPRIASVSELIATSSTDMPLFHQIFTMGRYFEGCLIPRMNMHGMWADSAYSLKYFQVLLNLSGFESLIHENSTRNHPLNEASKKLNRIRSITRACMEHVFGCMAMSNGEKPSRKIGSIRNEDWLGQKNLILNFLRFLQCSKDKKVLG